MSTLTYTPDQDIKVHEEGAIRLICAAFQSHENGLPEWLKNSADAYARDDAPEAKRVIVVFLNSGGRGRRASISCLDFCGMTSKVIEEDFRIWADPEAARRGSKSAVQGGHGNGGKCYMTQMFEDYAIITTVNGSKGSRYGVVGGAIKFGYVPDRQRGRDFVVKDMRAELQKALDSIGCSLNNLPKAAIAALKIADGFTLISGVGPKGYGNRIPAPHLIEDLQEHPQMIRTLEICKVTLVVNGEIFDGGKPLVLPEIKPMEGEQPRVITIPNRLKDPSSGTAVSTTNDGSLPPGSLTLRTSSTSMRYGKKGRHNIIYIGQSGYIGYVPVTELDVWSPYRDRMYGECVLESLEQFKQNDRAALAKSPLTRAVQQFITQQLDAYAKEFEKRDQQSYKEVERNAVTRMNEALDRWKNRFLNEFMERIWGPGGPERPPQPPLPTGKPAKLEITLSHQMAGLGVALRPMLKFYDSKGQQIRSVPYKWISDDNNVAMVDEDLLVINTFSYGKTEICAETLQGRLRSNSVPLEVVRIRAIQIVPTSLEMGAGTRQRLEALCKLDNGDETSSVYLMWTEDDQKVVRVSASGLVYGFAPGETKVYAMDEKCTAKEPATIKVVPSEGPGRKGRGFPLILVSGKFQLDPDTNEAVNFSREDPPIAQRPVDADRNIWWINSASPLARLYLDISKGYGYESREWRMYHVDRYIDALVQITLRHAPTDSGQMTVSEWTTQWGLVAAEIQSRAASELTGFISDGELPGE